MQTQKTEHANALQQSADEPLCQFRQTTLTALASHLEINLDEFCHEHFAKDFDSLTKREADDLYFRLRAIKLATKPDTHCLECGRECRAAKCDLCREGIDESQLYDMVRRNSSHELARGLRVVREPFRHLPPSAIRFRLDKDNERP